MKDDETVVQFLRCFTPPDLLKCKMYTFINSFMSRQKVGNEKPVNIKINIQLSTFASFHKSVECKYICMINIIYLYNIIFPGKAILYNTMMYSYYTLTDVLL